MKKNPLCCFRLPLVIIVMGMASFFLFSCKTATKNAYYYDRPVFQLTLAESKYLKGHHVERLLVHFFEVKLDSLGQAGPYRKISVAGQLPEGIEIVPVVTVDQSILEPANRNQQTHSVQILNLVTKIAKRHQVDFYELHLQGNQTVVSCPGFQKLADALSDNLKEKGKFLSTGMVANSLPLPIHTTKP